MNVYIMYWNFTKKQYVLCHLFCLLIYKAQVFFMTSVLTGKINCKKLLSPSHSHTCKQQNEKLKSSLFTGGLGLALCYFVP